MLHIYMDARVFACPQYQYTHISLSHTLKSDV